jgi:hypothetical protein
MKRVILIGVVFLLAVIIGVVVYVAGSLDSIVKAAVETYGSEITQANVKLAQVKIEPTSGEGTLKGLTVGNPQGFKSDSAFRLGEVSVPIDLGTVTEDTIVIKKILIAGPEITYELGKAGDNLRALQSNVDAYTAQFASGGAEEAADDSGGGPKLVIEDLYITGGKIEAVIPGLGGEKKLSAKLPDIHLSDIGKSSGGASPGEVVKKVMGAVTKGAATAVAALNVDAVKGLVELPARPSKRVFQASPAA